MPTLALWRFFPKQHLVALMGVVVLIAFVAINEQTSRSNTETFTVTLGQDTRVQTVDERDLGVYDIEAVTPQAQWKSHTKLAIRCR